MFPNFGDMNAYFHICTEGLERSLLFMDEDDYIFGMNLIPLCLQGEKSLKIVTFCLMSNHVHFIVRGDYEASLRFIRGYKRLLSQRLGHRGRKDVFKNGGGVLIKEMDDPMYIVKAIAYVLRNPVKAGVNVTPQGYRWSPARLYFSQNNEDGSSCRHISDLSVTERKKLRSNYLSLPQDWLVDSKGMILPENYVDVSMVESVYKKASQFMYYLCKQDDAMIELDTGVLAKSSYNYEELAINMKELLSRQYNVRSVSELGMQSRIELASVMKRRYGATPAKLSRLVGIRKELLEKLI